METNLIKEIKELLGLVESFKQELSKIPAKEGFKAVNQHIDTAISESEEAAKKIIDLIGNSLDSVQEVISEVEKLNGIEKEKVLKALNNILNNLTMALTLLEFQDILAQRLLKVKQFLSDIEKSIVKIALLAGIEETAQESEKQELKKKLEELEWKKEVSQDEVDEIMKQFGM
ncbi:chemotaxis protein CheZ [Desulfurobacterium pacificum]|uniref:Chemotaxis protein CheZ n=1 Tax=Desulfurobacterium pacificum TaxID=240166 RepID=A0ABY1NQ28_9BACT|nr:hypothetical protein [Desulfurobacterium pacificum]SMP15050.1 chemotaxis protein CheZ [Desulfurobacterium pacificum]